MTNRQKAHQENPAIAAMTDFLVNNEKKLKQLHKQYQKDTFQTIPFLHFVDYIFHNAQDLVIDPQAN